MVDPRWAENEQYFDGEEYIGVNDQIPDHLWHPVESVSALDGNEDSRRTTLDQYVTLLRWSRSGEQPIRKVQLWLADAPVWVETNLPSS